MAQATYKWAFVADAIVGYCSAGVLSDASWKQFVHELETNDVRSYLSVIGGTVDSTSVQRKMAVEVLNRKKIRVAVVVDDRIVRGVVTAAAWLGTDIKAFSWEDVGDAIAHLKISPTFENRVLEIIKHLQTSK